LTLEELASKFHYSRANINNLFKKYTGTTIRQYTKKLRLQKAERLLQDSRLSVEEVSMEVGYNDISYFIEQFKTCYGMTPLQYRKSK
jgi:AraC-like DNA-binding protein